jgi:lysozyme
MPPLRTSAPLRPRLAAPAITGTLLGTALALATPQIMQWEGKRNDPYRDIVGVLTVCHGETRAPMRHYSDAECSAMLAARVEADYARPILACVPGFAGHPRAFAASISLSYNIGVAGFCRSSAANAFRAGNWAGGCDAFLGWNRAGGRVVPGLMRRRAAERRLCRTFNRIL